MKRMSRRGLRRQKRRHEEVEKKDQVLSVPEVPEVQVSMDLLSLQAPCDHPLIHGWTLTIRDCKKCDSHHVPRLMKLFYMIHKPNEWHSLPHELEIQWRTSDGLYVLSSRLCL